MSGLEIEGSQINVLIEGNSTELIAGDSTTTVGGALTFTTLGGSCEFTTGLCADILLGGIFESTLGYTCEISGGGGSETNFSPLETIAPELGYFGLAGVTISSLPTTIELTPPMLVMDSLEVMILGAESITLTCGASSIVISPAGIQIVSSAPVEVISSAITLDAPEINLVGANINLTGIVTAKSLIVTGATELQGAISGDGVTTLMGETSII